MMHVERVYDDSYVLCLQNELSIELKCEYDLEINGWFLSLSDIWIFSVRFLMG